MNYGEWTIVALWTLNLVCAILLHGEQKKSSSYNFYATFFNTTVSFGLMYWAGLFRNI